MSQPTPRATFPLVVFIAVAVAHAVWLAWTIWDFRAEPFPSLIWTKPAWLTAFGVSWWVAARGRKEGAWIYIVLTAANLVLRFTLANPNTRALCTDALFPLDLLFCFVLLLYYKRFR